MDWEAPVEIGLNTGGVLVGTLSAADLIRVLHYLDGITVEPASVRIPEGGYWDQHVVRAITLCDDDSVTPTAVCLDAISYVKWRGVSSGVRDYYGAKGVVACPASPWSVRTALPILLDPIQTATTRKRSGSRPTPPRSCQVSADRST